MQRSDSDSVMPRLLGCACSTRDEQEPQCVCDDIAWAITKIDEVNERLGGVRELFHIRKRLTRSLRRQRAHERGETR